MLAVLIALLLIAVSVAGIYWLLKSMGEDGVEAAAPGSCKSGRCGVQPRKPSTDNSAMVEVQYVHSDEIKRLDGDSNNPGRLGFAVQFVIPASGNDDNRMTTTE